MAIHLIVRETKTGNRVSDREWHADGHRILFGGTTLDVLSTVNDEVQVNLASFMGDVGNLHIIGIDHSALRKIIEEGRILSLTIKPEDGEDVLGITANIEGQAQELVLEKIGPSFAERLTMEHERET